MNGSILIPNGTSNERGLERPDAARDADYHRIINDIPGDTYLRQILKAILLQFLIKQEPRMGWAYRKACDDKILVPHPNETVGSHQWGVAQLIKILSLTPKFQEEHPRFDRLKAIEMALIHDVPEAKVGDITPQDNIDPDQKHKLEREAINEMLSFLPESLRTYELNIYNTYEDRDCIESKFVKDCDKLDFIITALLLETQKFPKVSDFYANSTTEGFFTKIATELAETIIMTRNELVEKKVLFKQNC